MNCDDAYPSKYLKAGDLNGSQAAVVIQGVEPITVGSGAKAESKLLITFNGKAKGFLCNKTNKNVLKRLFGAETDAWVGQKVILYPTETEMGGEIVPCLRVREFKPGAPPPPKPVPEVVIDDSDVPFGLLLPLLLPLLTLGSFLA